MCTIDRAQTHILDSNNSRQIAHAVRCSEKMLLSGCPILPGFSLDLEPVCRRGIIFIAKYFFEGWQGLDAVGTPKRTLRDRRRQEDEECRRGGRCRLCHWQRRVIVRGCVHGQLVKRHGRSAFKMRKTPLLQSSGAGIGLRISLSLTSRVLLGYLVGCVKVPYLRGG